MAGQWREDGSAAEFEVASRLLLRRLSETSEEMAAAEPGTDDFLAAYQESQRLRSMYRHVRDTWEVPTEVWSALPETKRAPDA